jgi:DNA-binding beta-propeller fold protein YncE
VHRSLAAAVLGALLLAGCGSETVHELPPAAEPPRSPALSVAPAGDVRRVGNGPEGVVVDSASGTAAVAMRDPNELALVDLRRRLVIRRIPLPGAPRHLGFDAQRAAALVPAETADRFLAVRIPSGRVLQRAATGAHPHDVTALPGDGVVIGDERGDGLTVLRAGRSPRRIGVAAQPGGVTTTASGRLIAVVSVRERVLELFDARTLRRVGRAAAGVGPTHVACGERGPWCWVLDTQGDALLVFRATTGGLELTRRVHLPGGPYGLAVDRRRGRLWVTLPGRNEVVWLPAHGRPHVVGRWPTVRQPDSVAVDEKREEVVITGRAAGVLQLLRP